jgi:hypothetical protein
MSVTEGGSIQFSPADLRTWNESGFEEVSASLAEASRRFSEADNLREKELAKMRLDSLEQLYRLTLQVARERFERARDAAAERLREVVEQLQAARLPAAVADRLWNKVSDAGRAFAVKRFDQTIEDLAVVEVEINRKPSRRLGIAMAEVSASPAAIDNGTRHAPPGNGSLLGLAVEHENRGRLGAACRLYVSALAPTAPTTVAQP